MTEQATETRKRKRSGRSPSYPGIGLGEALQRAQALYSQEREHAASVETILGHWGYELKSGAGLVVLAALKKFGLLVDEGSGLKRKARLSDAAVRILLDERQDSTERQRLIQQAALNPTIHMELWKKYGASLPSSANLRHELRFDKGFTGRGVDEFIPQFRSTLAFAQLTEHDKLSGEDEDKEHHVSATVGLPYEAEGHVSATATIPIEAEGSGYVTATLAVASGKWATLRAPSPMTEKQWEQLKKALEAQKPGFLAPDEKE